MASTKSGAQTRAEALKAAGVSDEAQNAFLAAFEALAGWRDEVASAADRNGNVVFDELGTAAKAMGWPPELVDMTRQQMQQGSKMQLQMMDQVMDVWEQQVRTPGAGMPTIPGMPGMPKFDNPFATMGGSGGAFPGMPDMSSLTNPMQFWMQAAEMWQKNWATAMQSIMDIQKSALDKAGKGGPFGG